MNRKRIRVFGLGLGMLVCSLLLLALLTSEFVLHFDPLRGIYSYDPRADKPSSFFLSSHPEQLLVQSLTSQVQREGTYPSTEKRRLVNIVPVHVDLATYSDWAAEARVTARLGYDDGTASLEVFRFRDTGSEGALMPLAPGGEMSIHAHFDRLGDCKREAPGKSYCVITLLN